MKTTLTIDFNDFLDMRSNLIGSVMNQGNSLELFKQLSQDDSFKIVVTTNGVSSHSLFYDENSKDIKLKEL